MSNGFNNTRHAGARNPVDIVSTAAPEILSTSCPRRLAQQWLRCLSASMSLVMSNLSRKASKANGFNDTHHARARNPINIVVDSCVHGGPPNNDQNVSQLQCLVMPAARSPTTIIQQQQWHFCQVPLPRTSCEVNSPIYYDHAINSLIVVGKWGNAQD